MSQKDIHDVALLTLEAIKAAKSSGELDPTLSEYNDHLATSIINWLGMMRRRPLTSAYEFLTPPADSDGRRAGWYWRHTGANPRDWVNWHGPFTSRKGAIEAKLALAPRTRALFVLEKVEAEIFGEAQ